VLLSGLGYALFLNLKNLLLINRLIDHGIGWFSFDLGSSKDFGGPKIRAGMMKEEGI